MDRSSGTWRPHPFEVGVSYVAVQSFTGFPRSEFVAGQSYELQHVGYSRYDSSTVFTFQAKGSTDPCYWWWYDQESATLCHERFRVAA
jgi:hypothetical protein